jgi:hypothetical protein
MVSRSSCLFLTHSACVGANCFHRNFYEFGLYMF